MFFRRFFRFSSAFFTNSSFNDLKINPQLKEILKNQGYNFMTPVQSHSLPEILNHKNCLVLSETGFIKKYFFFIDLIFKSRKWKNILLCNSNYKFNIRK